MFIVHRLAELPDANGALCGKVSRGCGRVNEGVINKVQDEPRNVF